MLFRSLAGQFQRFGNFAFDPLQGHIVVPISHDNSSLCSNASSWVHRNPCGSEFIRESVGTFNIVIACCTVFAKKFAPQGLRLQPQPTSLDGGKVNPDTERRISLAIFARLPMLSAVAAVPDVVWVVVC